MAPRTTRASKKTNISQESTEVTPSAFVSNDTDSYRLFILPRNASPDSRVISLPRATNKAQTRYLYCLNTGLYEYTKISAPPGAASRSWLLSKCGVIIENERGHVDSDATKLAPQGDKHNDCSLDQGYIQSNADLYVATPFDPLFLSSPLFASQASEKAVLFRLVDDYIDELCKDCKQLDMLFRENAFRRVFEQRFGQVCQVQHLGEDRAYKPDLDLLLKELIAKAERIVSSGWASSMETALVQKPLEVPLLATQSTMADLLEREEREDNAEKQNALGAEEEKLPSTSVSEAVVRLQRLHVAIRYMLSSYFPPDLRQRLSEMLATQDMIDFKPLYEHQEHVQKIKDEVKALRAVSDNITRKRAAIERDEQAAEREEKKRRKEEEEKKLKAEPRAIKQLKKVNTSGMKKLSSFFTKSTPALEKSETVP